MTGPVLAGALSEINSGWSGAVNGEREGRKRSDSCVCTALGAALPRGASKKPRRTPAGGAGALAGCVAAVRTSACGAVADCDCHCSGGGASSSPLAACHLALNAAASADSASSSSLGSRSTMPDIHARTRPVTERGGANEAQAEAQGAVRMRRRHECRSSWWCRSGG